MSIRTVRRVNGGMQKEAKFVNKRLLCEKMAARGLTQEALAERLNIDRTTLNRKLNGVGKGFFLCEAAQIGKALELSAKEMLGVFFGAGIA